MSPAAPPQTPSADPPPADAVPAVPTPRAGLFGGYDRLRAANPVLLGTLLTASSALNYSAANVFLRQMARPVDFDWAVWVTANKAVVSFLAALAICLLARRRGEAGFPPRRLVPSLLLAGFLTQVVGNLCFQYALSLGGLALTVPLTFSTLIITGAVGGRLFLREPVRPKTLAAIAVMIAAVFILKGGADEASAARTGGAGSTTPALLMGCLAGVGYGGVGIVVRSARKANVPVSATLVWISATGVFGIGALALVRNGPGVFAATAAAEWLWMFLASLGNAVAFFSVAAAYGLLPVKRVNLVNASQAAIGGVAGVLIFGEPLTGFLIGGTAATILGLVITSLTGDGRPPAAGKA